MPTMCGVNEPYKQTFPCFGVNFSRIEAPSAPLHLFRHSKDNQEHLWSIEKEKSKKNHITKSHQITPNHAKRRGTLTCIFFGKRPDLNPGRLDPSTDLSNKATPTPPLSPATTPATIPPIIPAVIPPTSPPVNPTSSLYIEKEK